MKRPKQCYSKDYRGGKRIFGKAENICSGKCLISSYGEEHMMYLFLKIATDIYAFKCSQHLFKCSGVNCNY